MTATATITTDPLVDISLPFVNIAGKPLFALPRPLTPEQTNAITAIYRRGRAQRALVDYAKYAVLDEKFTPALHHKIICDAIDKLINDEYDDLIINTPPGAAKSTYTSHALGAYYLGRFPKDNVILATHTGDLSERWSRMVRNTLEDTRHLEVFPTSTLSKDSTSVGRWATSLGGQFLAAGVGASILGFRADIAIIDDPIGGFEQAQSETQLAKVHNWFETDLITRLKPRGKIVTICQRLSANDLAGYMIARNALNPTRRQRVLILRMESEGDDDGTHRAIGERLWPEWFTPEMVADNKRDDYKWRTLYQQRPPSASGDWVSQEQIVVVDIPPITSSRYLLTDLALSVNKGDYSVHLVAGVTEDGRIVVEYGWRARSAIEATVGKHLDLVTEYKPQESLIDDDNASKVYAQLLASTARERGVAVPWRMMPMRGQNKETRAAPLRGLFREGRVIIKRGPWVEWLTRELLAFPNAMGDGVDDSVDALSLIGRRLVGLARSASPAQAAAAAPTTQDMTLDGLYDERDSKRSAYRARL